MKYNKNLSRKLKRLDLAPDRAPNLKQWQNFLAALSQRYDTAERDRKKMQRSFTLTSIELEDRWNALYRIQLLQEAILSSSLDCIVSLDQNGIILEFNPAAEQVFGYKRFEALGKCMFSLLLPEDDQSNLKAELFNFIKTGGTQFLGKHLELMALKADGSLFPVEIAITAVQINNEWTFPAYIRDLSEKKMIEDLVETQRAQIISSAKMAAVGEMAGNIAHEINTPLSTIVLTAEMLLAACDEPNLDREHLRTSIKTIESTVNRISKIVQGLRYIARQGTADPMEKVKAKEVVEETILISQPNFQSKGVKLKVQVPENIEILCRPIELSQALLNLLNNACDAVKDKPAPWVKITAELRDNCTEISVTDCGEGVPEEIRPKIMQPFFTTKEVGKGTGLGLSITQGIVRGHKGHLIYDESSPNTRFVMRLPADEYET